MNSITSSPPDTRPEVTPGFQPDGPLAIETHGLGYRYGDQWAVRGLALKVPRGSVFGFLGLNGAGKSTTIRMLLGLLNPHEGRATVLGLDPARADVEVKRRVGYVPDTPTFYDWMTVKETFAFIGHYRKAEWDDARALRLARDFDVPLDQPTGSLSRGQRAKVSLILAVAFHPELLLLDEPTLGLDPIARRQFVEGLLGEYMDGTRTVLISSHLIHEIAGIVDHIGILSTGELIRTERVDSLLAGLKRVRMTFPGEPPAVPPVSGLVRSESSGRDMLLTIERFDAELLASDIQGAGADSWSVEDLSLEDAFVELAGREARP